MIKDVKKVVAIHDISGLGRCSLTAAIPILSVLGVQACPFPTAILSCQTAYENFSFFDLTDEMINYKKKWDEMGFKFDGVYSGFLGAEKQIDIVKEFIESQKGSFVLIDPVMGDDGKIYKTYSESMCEKMKGLVALANVTTPNLTEACILSNRNYKRNDYSINEIEEIAKDICKLGTEKVVITGIIKGNEIINFAYDSVNERSFTVIKEYYNKRFGGTGDIFASIVCGMLINGNEFKKSVVEATNFICNSIKYSSDLSIDPKNGVVFEPVLKELLI